MNRNALLLLAGGLGVLALAGGAAIMVLNADWLKNPNAPKYLPLFAASESKWAIPHNLLARQGYQESRFRDDLVYGPKLSSAGAAGIMQIIPKWHPSLSPGDAAADLAAAFDPPRAIDYAASYLASLKKQFGSWALALAAYNAGPGNVTKYKGVPPFAETQKYVAQITGDLIDPNNPASAVMYA